MTESESEAPPPAQNANPVATAATITDNNNNTSVTPTTPTIIPNPHLKLPPVVPRLGAQLEFDPFGNPYFKFPPFLAAPSDTGTPLVPYVLFKPAGIVISLDPDEVEVDGEGVETVQLSAKHVAPGDKEKKKKRRRTAKKGPDGAPGPEDMKRPAKWWEDWMEGEDMRRADGYDPNLPRRERFAQGAADFQHGRKWTPPLQSVYDHFRFFVGLKSNKRRRFGKGGAKHSGAVAEEEDEDEDDADDEDELMLTAEQEKQLQQQDAVIPANAVTDLDLDDGGDTVMHSYLEEIDAELEAQELRMDAFLNDPELSLKIFFSSFYKDKGLWWSVPKLRDGPILIRFFLQFFIRNQLMNDYDRAFNKALLLVDLARIELPLTSKISVQVPDAFSRACGAVWGSKVPSVWDTGEEWPSVPEPEKTETTKSNAKTDKNKEWEAELERQGAEKIDLSTIPPPPPAEPQPAQPQEQWGNVPLNGVAGTSTDTNTNNGDDDDQPDAPKWGSVDHSLPNPWGCPAAVATWDPDPGPPPFLMRLLGPTTLPLTHHVTLVEKSIRRVLAFTPPDPTALPGVLRRTLGSVLLAPWVDVAPEGAASTIVKPELLMEEKDGGRGKRKKGFDMATDAIRVYVAGATVDVMKEGMGMHAIWVRMGEEGEEGGDEAGDGDGGDGEKERKEKGAGAGKGKGKSGAGGGGGGASVSAAADDGGAEEDKEWWYLEFLYEVIPSFWTDGVPEGTAGGN
ncbi:hypothetical protein BU17DRAFT_88703 [Hysterangium stoloniferum]|nr:hypothetical protein BU17DRAFT_88703 [Hysterangium stoloniferum]